VADDYEVTATGLDGLDAAVAMDFPCMKRKHRTCEAAVVQRDKRPKTARQNRLLQMRVQNWKRKFNLMRSRVTELTTTKDGQFCRREWLVAVALSAPCASDRAQAQLFRDVCPTDDRAGLHRKTMSRIKDTFVETVKEFSGAEVADVVKAAAGDPAGDGAGAAQAASARAVSAATPRTRRRSEGTAASSAGGTAEGSAEETTPAAARADGSPGAVASPPAASADGSRGADDSPAAAGAMALRALRAVHGVTCLHIQDEAGLGLRSFRQDRVEPSRSRTSKVQSHVVQLNVDGATVDVPIELDALADKRAVTLATSLLGVRDRVIAMVEAGLSDYAVGEWWFWHVVVGDGINTNQRAGRVLAASALAAPPGRGRMRYFLWVIKCAAHMANLVTKNAVCGTAALLGLRESHAVRRADDAEAARKEAMGKHALAYRGCKVIVQLYKYLVPQYYDEFLASLQQAVALMVEVLRPPEARVGAARRAEALQTLYGKEVLPDALLGVCNAGISPMAHALSREEEPLFLSDPDTARRHICGRVVEAVRRPCLVSDSHPTCSRMFTFIERIFGLLTLVLLRLVPRVVCVSTVNVQEKSEGRMASVVRFGRDPEGEQYLKRTSLCCQISGIATAVAARKTAGEAPSGSGEAPSGSGGAPSGSGEAPSGSGGAPSGGGGEPTLVRIGRGLVTSRCTQQFRLIVGRLHLGADLDVPAALTTLLHTVCDIILRFAQYTGYPFRLWRLVARWNDGYLSEIRTFLATAEADLDLAAGVVLQKMAKAKGGLPQQIAWLASPSVQATLARMVEAVTVHTLDGERSFAEAKSYEAKRLCHVSVASRNIILRWFHRVRQERAARLRAAHAEVQRAQKLRINSAAWHRLRHQGVIPQPLGCAVDRRSGGGGVAAQSEMVRQGITATVNTYIRENADDLRAEIERSREAARSQRDRLLGGCPVDHRGFNAWFRAGDNESRFRKRMTTATAERRRGSKRMEPRGDLPEPTARIQPTRVRGKVQKGWPKFLHRRSGWHGVKAPGQAMRLFFLAVFDNETHGVEVPPAGLGRWFLSKAFAVEASVRPLPVLASAIGRKAETWEVVVDATATPAGVVVTGVGATEVVAPVPRPKRKARGAGRRKAGAGPGADADGADADGADADGADADGSSSSSSLNSSSGSSDDVMETKLSRKLVSDPSGSSRPPSVETSVDSAASTPREESSPSEVSEPDGENLSEEDDAAPRDVVRRARGPAGPRFPNHWWTVWWHPYFYITDTAGYHDIKIHIKGPYTSALHMGRFPANLGKALTPSDYGDDRADPRRTMLLLRAWGIMRARRLGWSKETSGRVRQEEVDVQNLERDIRAFGAPVATPLLGNAPSHAWLHKWVPDVEARLLA